MGKEDRETSIGMEKRMNKIAQRETETSKERK